MDGYQSLWAAPAGSERGSPTHEGGGRSTLSRAALEARDNPPAPGKLLAGGMLPVLEEDPETLFAFGERRPTSALVRGGEDPYLLPENW